MTEHAVHAIPVAPTTTTPRTRPWLIRVLGAGALVTLAVSLAGVTTASPAHAHDQLVSNTPESGAVLEVAPQEITLQYNNSVLDVGTQILVTNTKDEEVQQGEPAIHERTVSQPLTAELPDDLYTVTWRVVSSDGHPISGTFDFTVGEAQAPAQAKPATSDSESSSTSSQGDAHETKSSAPAEPGAAGTDWGRTALIAGIGAIVAVGGYFFMIRSSKRRK